MAVTILGIIILAIPFLLISQFADRKKGFVYILFFSILFHAFLAILAQFFGIFYYGVVLTATLLADVGAIIYWMKKGKFFTGNKVDWFLAAVIVISFLTLYQVHYRYTGKINLSTDQTPVYHEVKDMKYTYPYFSDEWYAVSFINYSINSHNLPFHSTLSGDFFVNLELFFHSFLSEIFLILGLNPLTQYVLISIFFNILVIILAYLFLRICGVSGISSAIASLSILYIACGANFPGLWHLLPVTMGLILSLAGFCFSESDDPKMVFLSFIATTLFYPPFFIFSGLGLLVYLFCRLKKNQKLDKDTFNKIGYFIFATVLIIPAVYIVLMLSPCSSFVDFIISKLFYVSFNGNFMPRYDAYNIIPFFTIILAMAGFYSVCKNRKYVFFQLILGVFLWIMYSFTIYRFIIEFERAVLLAAVIIVLVSGFGLTKLEKYIGLKLKNNGILVYKYAGIVVLGIFLILIPFYTQRDAWKNLSPINALTGQIAFPKSPANRYLTEDDIRIFAEIKNKKIFSLPWKGTVIGVATGNFPSITKEGTVSIGSINDYYLFVGSDCSIKKNIINKYKPDYLYLPDSNCPGFEQVDRSGEGFVLYRVDESKL